MSTEVFTEPSVPETEMERYVEREWDRSGSTSMCSDGTPVEVTPGPGVDMCYNESSDGSFARQDAEYVSSSSESSSREGSSGGCSLPLPVTLPERSGRQLAQPYFVFGGGAQEAVRVHNDKEINIRKRFDEHLYNAVPRAERGHDVAAPPQTSPDDIDIVAGMGALALDSIDDRVSVADPAGSAVTNSMSDEAPQTPAGAKKSGKEKDVVEDLTGAEWEEIFYPKQCCGARVTSSTGLACLAFGIAMWADCCHAH